MTQAAHRPPSFFTFGAAMRDLAGSGGRAAAGFAFSARTWGV